MKTSEIGRKLVRFANEDREHEALDELYAENIVSVENIPDDADSPMPALLQGLAAVREKHAWWQANNDVHSATAEGPYMGYCDDHFAIKFIIEVTPSDGQPTHMEELGLFWVTDGKISREEFLHIPD